MSAGPAMSALERLARRQPSVRRANKAERRIALRERLRRLRVLDRENLRLREALVEMLQEEEALELDGNWCSGWPQPPRLCACLALYIRYELDRGRDLDRLKRARAALGLPWWGRLDYSDGLQPGKGA